MKRTAKKQPMLGPAIATPDNPAIAFARDADADGVNLADDPAIAFIAAVIVNQQGAGFRTNSGAPYVDLRRVNCEECGAPGFNSGWGFWMFQCGAEVGTDGEQHEPCGSSDKENPNG